MYCLLLFQQNESPYKHRRSCIGHGEPHQAVGGGHAERATHVVERPPVQRASRPRLRPRPHHARRPLPRCGLLARAAHAHEQPVALRLRREEDRPARQRRVNLAEPRLHPLPQRPRLRAACIAEPSITANTQSPSGHSSSSAAIASLTV